MTQIAVLMATYNGSRYICEQLDSILNQTCQDFMIYIHDDGSDDGTVDIIKGYADKYAERITVLDYAPTGGAKNNFLSMLSLAQEPYIMFSDQDDIWKEEKIERTFSSLKEMEGKLGKDTPTCVFTDMTVVSENMEVIEESYFRRMRKNPSGVTVPELLADNVAPGCTCMINRRCKELAMSYEKIDNIKMHDWWCALIASACGGIWYIDWSSSFYRQHQRNVVGATNSHARWVKRITRNLLSGEQIKSSREGILEKYHIAVELGRLQCLNETAERFLLEMNNLKSKGKFSRMRFFWKHGLIKKDMKNVWKILLV